MINPNQDLVYYPWISRIPEMPIVEKSRANLAHSCQCPPANLSDATTVPQPSLPFSIKARIPVILLELCLHLGWIETQV